MINAGGQRSINVLIMYGFPHSTVSLNGSEFVERGPHERRRTSALCTDGAQFAFDLEVSFSLTSGPPAWKWFRDRKRHLTGIVLQQAVGGGAQTAVYYFY
jgi:hypothetical protein